MSHTPASVLKATLSTTARTAPYLLSPAQLRASLNQNENVKENKIVPIDASWFMPNLNPPRNPKEEFEARRLPGARFLDLDEVASPNELGLKHMMPSGEVFARACGESSPILPDLGADKSMRIEGFGISPQSHVVL